MPNREQRRSGASMSDNKIKITTNGNPYEIDLGALSALDEKDYFIAVGHTIMDLFTGAAGFSTYAVAGLVWLWRRRHNERTLTFAEVADEFKMSDLETLKIGDEEEDEGPQTDAEVPQPAYDGKDPEHSGGQSAPSSLASLPYTA
jgi:uncharacterized protein (TIGR03382 family)